MPWEFFVQLSNLSVSKKIWLLLLLVTGLLVATAVGLVTYMNHVAAGVEAQVSRYDQRILQTVRWRASTELAGSHIVAANMSSEPHVAEALMAKQADYSRLSNTFQSELEETLKHPQARQQLEVIASVRNKALAAAAKIRELRSQGDFDTAQQVVEGELSQAVQGLVQSLQDLVNLQTKLRDQIVRQGEADQHRATLLGAGVMVAAFILGLLLAQLVVRQITQPLARAVALADTIANGDLTAHVEDERQDELGHLLRSLDGMAAKLRQVVAEVRSGVDAVSSASGEIALGTHDLSARTEQTAANLEETAASMEQLTATVTQSSETARQANQLAGTAVSAATRGGDVVQQVVQSMEQISTSSRKINDIIGVIDGIAFQTNILALNAAVEAARAGEQGRGFAVVASEVRSLAGRSAEAAKEIKQLITDSVANVDTGSSQVALAGQSMEEIVASVRRVTDLIGEITASSAEQGDGISQVNQAVANLDQMTQQNAALVEESSAAASAMSEQAQRLAQVVSVFNVGTAQGSQMSRSIRNPVATAPKPSAKAPEKQAFSATAAPKLEKKPSKIAERPTPAAPKQEAKTAPAPKLTARPAPAAKGNEDDWETF